MPELVEGIEVGLGDQADGEEGGGELVHQLYVQTGAKGIVDAYKINTNGSLTATGSATVAGTVGGEGIAAN